MPSKQITQKEKTHREKMSALECAMLELGASDEFNVSHYFGHESYARVLFLKKGETLTGKIHRYSCINIVLTGDISVDTAEGRKRFKAPYVFVSPPGIKRAGYAHEDTIWVNFHSTKQTDPDKVEDEVIAKDYVDYDEGEAIVHEPAGLTPCEEDVFRSLVLKKFKDREDVFRMLIEIDK